MLPERDRWSRKHPVRDFQIGIVEGIENEDSGEIARIAPDDQGIGAVSVMYPRGQGIREIDDVIEDDAVALKAASAHRQKVDQEGVGVGRDRDGLPDLRQFDGSPSNPSWPRR